MKSYLKYLKFTVFILPTAFLLLSYLYKDTTYLFLTAITLILGTLLVLPNILQNKSLSIDLNKKLLSKRDSKKKSIGKQKLVNGKQSLIIYLLSSLVLFTLFFTIIGAYFTSAIPSIHNSIAEYYASQFLGIKNNWVLFTFLLLAIAFIGSCIKYTNSGRRIEVDIKKKLFLRNTALALGISLVSLLISLITLYLYAVVQLNIVIAAFNIAPSTVGVVYGKTNINNKLKSMTTSPNVIGSNSNLSNTILSIIINGSTNSSNYYQAVVINSIPHFLITPFNISSQPVYLVHSTLIINSIDKDTMQTISPALAHLLLQNYFKNHVWKSDPNIVILSRQDYLAFRQSEIDSQIKQLEDQVQKVESYIGQVESDIALSNQKISTNQSGLQQTESLEQSAYNYCVSLGYYDYFTNTFYPTYTQSQCSSQVQSEYASTIAQFQKNINDWNSELQTDEGYLSDAQNIEKEYKNAADYVNSQKDTTPDELGKFNEPNTVRVVLDSTSPKGINEFLETLIHENLHYQSSIKNRNFQFTDGSYDGFWEEGLTEYFARKVMYANFGVNINQGYPLLVKIVAQIAKKIPESTLKQIYFDKDDTTLQAALNIAYGSSFYKDTEPYFEYLSYLPDNLQLKYANNIMTRVGGKQLTASDLYSTDLQPQ